MADEPVNTPDDEEADQTPQEAVGEDQAEDTTADSPETEVVAESIAEESADAGTEESPEAVGVDSTATGDDGPAEATLDIGSESAIQVEIDIPSATPTIRGHVDKHGVAIGTGRRKTAVARVRVRSGSGKLTVNGQEMVDYFPLERDQQMILAPLNATGTLDNVDVWVRVNGGGSTGQTGAVVLGIARALQAQNPEVHHKLSEGGFLTRDGRMVERKKYGLKKARRSFQFSKR